MLIRIGLGLALASLGASAQGAILKGADDPQCRAALAYSEPRQGASVLVMKGGDVVCEGHTGLGAPDRRLEIWSGTKSLVGIMAAAAVQDGLLTLDEPVSKTLPEWRTPERQAITLRQVLTLTAGLPSQVGRAPEYAAAVAMPLSAAPGERYQYGPAPFQLFGEVMKRKLAAAGQPADPLAYLKRRILAPIGLAEIGWRRTPGGDPLLPQGASMTAREWARFGEFVRAGAKVNGKALVDEKAFAELFQGTKANPAYGVTWWLPRATPATDRVTRTLSVAAHPECAPADTVIAAGAGGQRLYVIPSLEMTIVRQAELQIAAGEPAPQAGPRWSDAAFLATLLPTPRSCEGA